MTLSSLPKETPILSKLEEKRESEKDAKDWLPSRFRVTDLRAAFSSVCSSFFACPRLLRLRVVFVAGACFFIFFEVLIVPALISVKGSWELAASVAEAVIAPCSS